MANTYFQFKQFKVEQDNTAMKVCTDSCIFGAWIDAGNSNKILDIGTGTGLLALMLAQRTQANIDAVEIEVTAAKQAAENVQRSPWADRIKVHQSSIQDYAISSDEQYDLIVTNPPFYNNYLKSGNKEADLAYHSIALSMEELLEAVQKLLKKDGKLLVLLPPYESELLREEALGFGFYTQKVLQIKDNEKTGVIREVTEFSSQLGMPIVYELIIKKDDNYSEAFVKLLKEYYLYL